MIEAYELGVAERDTDLTWADPNRADGEMTDFDDAYDAGRYGEPMFWID